MTKHIARSLLFALCLASLVGCVKGTGASSGSDVKLETEDQKTLYALGLIMGRNVKTFSLKPDELEIVKAGLHDSVTGAPAKIDLDTYGPKVSELANKRSTSPEDKAKADDAKKKGQDFADNVAKQKDATKSDSGVVIRVITPGNGGSPVPSDIVKVHYEGKLVDGTVFDSSIKRGEPVEFPLDMVVPCWTEAVQKMKKGEKAQVVCPSSMAYGDRGQPPTIPPGATLSFEIELIDFHKA